MSEMFVPTTSQNSRRGPKSRSQSPLATPEDLKNLLKESQNKLLPVQSRKNLNREAASRKDLENFNFEEDKDENIKTSTTS